MADRIDNLTERVQVVEGKLEQLTVTVTELSATMERGFGAVDEAFLEQRHYTEFCFARLETKMDAGFERVDARFEQIDARFDRVDARFDKMEGSLARVERKLDQFIDVQSKANELVERRLRGLESSGR